MEYIKEEQRDTDAGVRTSNIHLRVPRREKRGTEAILGWILAENFLEQIRNKSAFLRRPINHKQDKQKDPRYISVKSQDHKEKENVLKAGK